MLKFYVTLQTLFIAGADRLKGDNEKGATAVEYGIMVALIAAVIVGIVATLGTEIRTAFTTVVNALP
ncbi:Flp family type IVb pilin [Arthrobacter glacialis]|uniref:Flp family type IVb pilin n=1 Tax=Arthrobacter glacialis TaxID=1664 RepID=A0A2S3ZZZ4_ARTGL|nr:Flp family type IVb pilin [Arthrobacter glacialis]POH60715.1 Flp family type IVb pilin [Arthrobacter glacialis]POH74856.1 Flp family type IVb pilin [Arthrobacter glacialis]